ncbi:hypothetical protein [Maribacter sp. 2-571]|uniref:hypothetical protein n=1 Tax=Maribacter sp. 2-571 TaxID=3417569 RepID=UPI003D34BA0A
MKKGLLIAISLLVMLSCGGVKKTQEAINIGDYGSAIDKSIRNLVENKTKKGNQPYVLLLEEAYQKNTERELQKIRFLKNDENPANFEAIYTGYEKLRSIQERVRPLLPLYVKEERRNAKFSFNNYENEILDAKDALSEYLYDNASGLLANGTNKQDFRKAHDDFQYLQEINPGFEETPKRIQQAYAKGLDYVKVDMINDSDQIIPARLQEELLDFNTYGLDAKWIRYHTNHLKDIDYDYQMQVALRNIVISPEQVNEKQIIKERQIKDGYTYVRDASGNAVRDSLGNRIKVDAFKTVRCDFYQFTQFKSAQVSGMVDFTDLKTQQQINSYPLSSEFIFEHVYANYDGDRRALDNELVALLKLAAVPFPTNEQMVYDAGEDLKQRLKRILVRQQF